ncbi:MAG: NAD-dependent epimerase/dehydratase family protein [Kiloniellales bacterium]
MLEHGREEPGKPERVVILGRRGFVAGAIGARLERDSIDTLALGSRELDLIDAAAEVALADRLKESDALVVVSAIAPCKDVPAFMSNLAMVRSVCAALQRVRPAHLVYISSDAVYADGVNPVNERSCAEPSSLHGMMHAARELMLKTAAPGRLCILRPSLLYGAADPHNGYGPNRFRRLAAEGKDIVLFGEGEERRDHVLIDDLAEIVRLSLIRRSSGVLNVATGHSASFREVAERVAALFDPPVAVKGSRRRNPITHRHFDPSACYKAFPRFHYTPLADGLAKAHHDMMKGG